MYLKRSNVSITSEQIMKTRHEHLNLSFLSMKLFCLALSEEQKQQIISSAIIPVYLLGILTSYAKVSIHCIATSFISILRLGRTLE